MTALAGTGNPAVTFNPGVKVRGPIVALRDKQATAFKSTELKWYDAEKTQPIMDTVATLELPDGSNVDVYISSKLFKAAVKEAFRGAGRTDLTLGDILEAECTGYDGAAKTYRAAYEIYDPTV